MYDMVLIVGLLATFVLMNIGIKLFGTGGAFAGFFVGAIMTGVIAASAGVEMGDAGCTRYSSFASDC